MGVSYAYAKELASTLYNDVEQRPEMVKQGLTRAGIEKVRSLHLRLPSARPALSSCNAVHLPNRCSGPRRSSASRG